MSTIKLDHVGPVLDEELTVEELWRDAENAPAQSVATVEAERARLRRVEARISELWKEVPQS